MHFKRILSPVPHLITRFIDINYVYKWTELIKKIPLN